MFENVLVPIVKGLQNTIPTDHVIHLESSVYFKSIFTFFWLFVYCQPISSGKVNLVVTFNR